MSRRNIGYCKTIITIFRLPRTPNGSSDMWEWTFLQEYISAIWGRWPRKFLHLLEIRQGLLVHTLNGDGSPPKKVLTVYHLNECSVLVTSWNWTKYRPTLTLWQLIAPLLFTGLGLGFTLWFAFGSPEGLRLDSNELVSNLTRLLGISTVDYCNSLLARVPYYQLDRLQSVLNTATRLIVGAKKHDHIKHVLWDRLHWLPVPQRIQFKQWIWSIFC